MNYKYIEDLSHVHFMCIVILFNHNNKLFVGTCDIILV